MMMGIRWDESWQKTRMRVLVRDDFHCQAQQEELSGEPCAETRLEELHVHHRIPRMAGGGDDMMNLVTLCREHHGQLHPWMDRLRRGPEHEADYPLREL